MKVKTGQDDHTSTVTKGRQAERQARDFLKKKGFRILEQNYRCRFGEIDIVAEQGEELVFVEVRSLGPRARHLPEETIVHKKQRKLSRTAQAYLQDRRQTNRPARFDVVAVETGRDSPVLRHLPNAFELWEP
jgi:putative endonuclease